MKSFLLDTFPDTFGKPSRNDPNSKVLIIPAKLICGGLAGAFAQTVSYPLDVARRKMQLAMMFPDSHRFTWVWVAPEEFEWNFKYVIFKWILMIDGGGISCEISLICHWTSLMSSQHWCCQATSHYLSQCWPRSQSPYGVTRPEWVKSLWPRYAIWQHRFGLTLVQVMAWCLTAAMVFNSLAPGRCERNFINVIFEHLLQIKFMSTSCEIALKWMSQNPIDEIIGSGYYGLHPQYIHILTVWGLDFLFGTCPCSLWQQTPPELDFIP